MTDELSTAVGVTLPPRIRAQVQILARDIGLNNIPGPIAVEFMLSGGELEGTYLKLGKLSNAKLEQLAKLLSSLR